MAAANVQVAVRIRPLIPSEVIASEAVCLKPDAASKSVSIVGNNSLRFGFDAVFDQATPQQELFERFAEPMLDKLVEGVNGTILAYGQTASGKTFTLGTSPSPAGLPAASAGAAAAPSGMVAPLASASEFAAEQSDQRGIIPRVAESLFTKLQSVSSASSSSASATLSHYSCSVRVTFVEVFGEQVRDLLTPLGCPIKPLSLRESPSGAITLLGVTERACKSAEDVMAVLEEGALVRATASTKMNAASSRSHAIFTIIVDQRRKTAALSATPRAAAMASTRSSTPKSAREGEGRGAGTPLPHAGPGGMSSRSSTPRSGGLREGSAAALTPPVMPAPVETRLISKANVVDLAGSERLKKTLSEGKRLKEGISINKGLLALSKCIDILANEEEKRKLVPAPGAGGAGGSGARRSSLTGASGATAVHVPYRDSKLTRLLRDSLGGNAATMLIACVSPAESNLEESLSTLRYAARARNIKNRPVVNREVDLSAAHVAQLRAEIDLLRAQMAAMAAKTAATPSPIAGLPPPAPAIPSLLLPGISLQALLEATGCAEPEEIIDRLTVMRKALDECPTLRSRAEEAEEELGRVSSELDRVKSALEMEAQQRTLSELRTAATLETSGNFDGSAIAMDTSGGTNESGKEGELVSPEVLPAGAGSSPVTAASTTSPGRSNLQMQQEQLLRRIAELEAELQLQKQQGGAARARGQRQGRNDHSVGKDTKQDEAGENQYPYDDEAGAEEDNEVFIEEQERTSPARQMVSASVEGAPGQDAATSEDSSLRGRPLERHSRGRKSRGEDGMRTRSRTTSMISDHSLERALEGVDTSLLVIPEAEAEEGSDDDKVGNGDVNAPGISHSPPTLVVGPPDQAAVDSLGPVAPAAEAVDVVTLAVRSSSISMGSAFSPSPADMLPSPSVVAAIAQIDSQAAAAAEAKQAGTDSLASSRRRRKVPLAYSSETLRAAMERNAETLRDSIAAKERLVAALLIKDVQLERMKSTYEEKMTALSTTIAALLRERDEIVAEMERHADAKAGSAADSASGEPAEEEERIKRETAAAVAAAYEKKLAAVEQQLTSARQKAQQLERYRVMRARTSAEVTRLQAELTGLKKAKVAQQALIRAERRKFADAMAEKERQVGSLKRGEMNLRQALQRVESDLAKKEVVLKRKMEEAKVAAAATSSLLKRKSASLANMVPSPPPSIHDTTSPTTSPHKMPPLPPSVQFTVSPVSSPGFQKKALRSASSFSIPAPPLSLSPPLPLPSGVVLATATRAQNRLRSSAAIMPPPMPPGVHAAPRHSSLSGLPPPVPMRPSTLTAGALLRRKLEEAVGQVQERERKVEELERRLKARESDVKLLQALIAEKEGMMAMDVTAAPATQGASIGSGTAANENIDLESAARAAGEFSSSVDFDLVRDINDFFAEAEAEQQADTRVQAPLPPLPSTLSTSSGTQGSDSTALLSDSFIHRENGSVDAALPPPEHFPTAPPSASSPMDQPHPHQLEERSSSGQEARTPPQRLRRILSMKEEETLRSLEAAIEAARSKVQFGEEKIRNLTSRPASPSPTQEHEAAASAPLAIRDELLAFLHLQEMAASAEPDADGAKAPPVSATALPTTVDPSLTARVLFEMLLEARREQDKKDKEAAIQRLQLAELNASLKTAQEAFKKIRQKTSLSSSSATSPSGYFSPVASKALPSFRSAVSNFGALTGRDGVSSFPQGSGDFATASSTKRTEESLSPAFQHADAASAAPNSAVQQQMEELRRDRDRLREEVNRLATLHLKGQEKELRREVSSASSSASPGIPSAADESGGKERVSRLSTGSSVDTTPSGATAQASASGPQRQRRHHRESASGPALRPFLPVGRGMVLASGTGNPSASPAPIFNPAFAPTSSSTFHVPVLSPLQANLIHTGGGKGGALFTGGSAAAASGPLVNGRRLVKAALEESVSKARPPPPLPLSAAATALGAPMVRPPLAPSLSMASFRSAGSSSPPLVGGGKLAAQPPVKESFYAAISIAGGQQRDDDGRSGSSGSGSGSSSSVSPSLSEVLIIHSGGGMREANGTALAGKAASNADAAANASAAGAPSPSFHSPESFHAGAMAWQ